MAENHGGTGGGAAAAHHIRRPSMNPNWAQLQKILKASAKPSRRPPPSPAEADASATPIVLEPTSTDCSLTRELAMDCEMVGVGADGTKSALGRITLVNVFGNVVYDEFVRPLERVVDFRTAISGIRPKNLRKAKDFCTVQKEVAVLIEGKILVGHALHNDLKVLFLTHPKKHTRDTSKYQPFQSDGKRVALRHLASQILGVKIQQQEHCSIEDARAAMFIYLKHRKSWEKSIKGQPKPVATSSCRQRKKRRQEG